MGAIQTLPVSYQRAAAELERREGGIPWGYSATPPRYTFAKMETFETVREAHPENVRRCFAAMIWIYFETGVLYGVGQMERDWDRALSNWQQNPNQFSHPETSYHVRDPSPVVLLPTACDWVGTGRLGAPPDSFNAMRAHVGKFGLNTVSGSTERHHTQIFAGSKRLYNANPGAFHVGVFNNWPAIRGFGEVRPEPQPIPTPTPTGDDDPLLYQILIRYKGTPHVYQTTKLGGGKIWLRSPGAVQWVQTLLRLNGLPTNIQDHIDENFAGFGPLIGGGPAGVDSFGVPTS